MRYIPLALMLSGYIAAAQEATWSPIGPQPNTITGQYQSSADVIRQSAQPRSYVLPTDQVFPHLATGDGWETILVLVNMSTTRVSFTQKFYDQSGNPMPVTFRSIPDNQLTTTSATQGSLAPGASFNILLFDAGTPLQVGWSGISYDTTSARIGGYAIFRNRVRGRADFEALVPLSAFDDTRFYFPFDNLEDFVTSMALLNPASNVSATVSLTFLDTRGVTIGRDTLILAPGQQKAFSVPQVYPITQNRVGTILVESNTTRLSGLGFRFNPGGAFATIPIMNWAGMF
jgi:hypothetical protein